MPNRGIWLDALFVWGSTRILLLTLTFLVPALGGQTSILKNPVNVLQVWYTQDAAHFIYIAQHGYTDWWRAAFFPLFPLLEHVLAPIFGGNYGLAGQVVSNLAFLGALVILRGLVERDFGADVAHRTILYLAIFPAAFYSFAPYSESLSLCLTLGVFAALRQRRWWLAGALGGIGALASAPAVLLLVPFAVEFLVARRYRMVRWWESSAALLIPAGTGAFMVYCQLRFHDLLAFLHAQSHWTRGSQSPGAALVSSVRVLAATRQPEAVFTQAGPTLAAVLIFVVLGGLLLWRLPRSYGIYSATLLLAYLLLVPSSAATALQGQGYYVAGVFPVFILLAQWGVREKLHEALVLAQVGLFTVLVSHFFTMSTWGPLPLWW